ncbi:MAG: hypothetical protein EON52_00035 [Actinomycetales bacterium]|nr:MAG: hypothetical protein EON52_00035 [Actinomycetales bacterium]
MTGDPLPHKTLSMRSTSRAEDMGYLAMADVAAATGAMGVDYRLIGGHMVSHLVYAYAVEGVPTRETADADLGATGEVVADPRLLEQLDALGYDMVQGNRFERNLTAAERAESESEGDGPRPVIDVLIPSGTSQHQPGQSAGELVVDAIPGLLLALNADPVELTVAATLTTGAELVMSVSIPSPKAALCLKLLSYGSRFATKDVTDIWRLLAVCRAAGVTPDDWYSKGTQGDALEVLDKLVSMKNPSLARALPDQRAQATVVALRNAVAPKVT